VTEDLFLALKDDGIRGIRIPVTWRHFMGAGPDYPIDAAWMGRVEEVVNYAVDNDMYAILNLHHDGGTDSFAWLGDAQNDYEGTMEKFQAVWLQIAERFRNHPHRLVFESMNEVSFPALEQSAGEEAAYALLNDMNQHFVDWIRASGGTNATRHLLLAGYATDIRESVAGWALPEDPADRSIISIHYYTPWRFCITADRTTWGTAEDLDELTARFDQLETAFIDNGVPVILGEYGVVFRGPESDSRIFWLEHVTKAAHDRGIAPFLWDNGEEVNRDTYEWRTDGLLEAILRASSGEDYEITRQ
jgi:endoglucanase